MKVYQAIETLWEYMQLRQSIEPCELILVMGGNDIRVAEYAAELFMNDMGQRLLFSGASGRYTEDLYSSSEAETFARIAMDMGVPQSMIDLETKATNTGENIRFSQQYLSCQQRMPSSVLLVHKPYMERRALATFECQWQGNLPKVFVTSTGENFVNYLSDDLPASLVTEALIGDFERIRDYPARGFQTQQPIPDAVYHAYETLKAQHLG